jgi:dihydrofolate reductase
MGRIVVTEFVSLDGVMEDPGGSENSKHGGWAFEFSRGEEGDKFKYDELLESEAFLLGRVTYDGFADAWPEREGDFADRFNNMPKYVVGSKADASRWTNTTVLDGDLVDAVKRVRDEHRGNIYVHGSRQLAQTLLDNDLVDQLNLMVFPVVLGTGKRMFGETKKKLRLVDSKVVGDGVAILIYEPATRSV